MGRRLEGVGGGVGWYGNGRASSEKKDVGEPGGLDDAGEKGSVMEVRAELREEPDEMESRIVRVEGAGAESRFWVEEVRKSHKCTAGSLENESRNPDFTSSQTVMPRESLV